MAMVVVTGLTVGWVLGLGGTFLEAGSTARAVFWVVSSVALLVGVGLLAAWSVRSGLLFMAGGSLVLMAGEAMIHAQGPEAVDAFAAATFAYVAALLLTAASPWPPVWARVASAGSAVAFAIHAASYLGGSTLGPDSPAAGAGYGLLTLTLIGWSVRLLRPDRSPATAAA